MAALQCERRLWLADREALAGTPDPAAFWGRDRTLALHLAQRSELPGAIEALCPHAREVPPGQALEAALEHSRRLLADPSVRAVRGALLQREGWVGRVELIERGGDGLFGLRVAVADTVPREIDLDRAALLAFLTEGSSLRLGDVQLWFLDRDYRRGPGELHWKSLVRRRDVTGDVRLLLSDVPAALARAEQAVAREQLPDVQPSPHCFRPLRCEFWERCTGALPRGALAHLPRLRPEQFHALQEKGIRTIGDIPDGEPLEPIQLRTRDAWRSGRAVIAAGLAERLRELQPETAYLDFETAVPRLPLLPQSGPLEPIPMQWSLLHHGAEQRVTEREFLAEPGVDPRLPFAQSLLQALALAPGPIAVYSDFESRVLERLELQLPELASELAAVRARLVDLLAWLREYVAHPDFLGSYSLKRVAPVLSPKLSYADLGGVASGAAAARVLEAWLVGDAGDDAPSLRAALLAYCRRDVEALRAVHVALLELVARAEAPPAQ